MCGGDSRPPWRHPSPVSPVLSWTSSSSEALQIFHRAHIKYFSFKTCKQECGFSEIVCESPRCFENVQNLQLKELFLVDYSHNLDTYDGDLFSYRRRVPEHKTKADRVNWKRRISNLGFNRSALLQFLSDCTQSTVYIFPRPL